MNTWKPPLLVAVALIAALAATALGSDRDSASAAGPVTVSGILHTVFGDPTPGSGQPARTAYTLTDSSGNDWTLDMSLARGDARALNGKNVQVTGQQRGPNQLVVQSFSGAGGPGAFPGGASPISGTQKWITLACRYSDDTNEPVDLAFLQDMMGPDKPGAEDYWAELSYGNISIEHEEYDWVALPSPTATYFDNTDDAQTLDLIAEDCVDAHDGGVDFTGVDGINFILNAPFDNCCSWGGGTNVSTAEFSGSISATWMRPSHLGTTSHGILGQEMGHGFGLPHEGCIGTESPYDSNWDVMSNASGHQIHTNAAFKDNLGWIAASRKYTADASLNQIVTLERLALPGPGGYLLAQIPIGGGSTYYTVEARKFAGYDDSPDSPPAEAVVIHKVDWSLEDKIAQVVDGDGDGDCNDAGGQWLPGEIFVDEANAISIAVVSESSSGFTIAINPTWDLSITKIAAPDPAIAGAPLTYTVFVGNSGPGPAAGVVVTDTLPAGVDFVADTDSCVEGPVGTLTCTLGTVPVGGTSFDILVNVDSDVANGGPTSLTNNVEVTSEVPDEDLSNNTYQLSTLVVAQADLRLTKECKPDQPNKQPAGTETFCDIYIDNLGPSDATSVVVMDQIISSTPVVITGYQLSSTSGPAGSCLPATPTAPSPNITVTCTDNLLPAGARNTIKVRFRADDEGDVDDTASVTSNTPDPNTSNNLAIGRVSFAASADLVIDKTASPDPVVAGEQLTYTITVTNNGPSIAAGVVVKDDLPAQLTNVSVISPGNTCNAGVPGDALQPLTCNLGNMADGAVEVITIVATVKADTAHGTILFNQARVSSGTSDPNNGNNNDSVPIDVVTRVDLVIEKTSDANTYKPNTTISYRIRVTNNGPSYAQDVVVVDTLPDLNQVIYLSDTGGCILSAPKTLECSIGTMAPGEVREFFIYVKVQGAKGDITNLATVSSSTTELVPANNSASLVVTVKGGGKP